MLTDKTPGPLGGQAEHRGDLLPFWRVFWAYGLCFSTLWSGIFRFAQPFRPRKAVASYWRRIKSSELAQSELLSNLVFEACRSCGDLVWGCGFNSVFEPDAGDDFGEVVKAA